MTIYTQWKFELVSWLRNGEQALLNFILPLLGLVAAHFLPGENQFAITAMAFLGANAASAFTGLAIALSFDRRYGILKFYATTPLKIRGFYITKTLVALAVSLIQAIVLYAVAAFLQLPIASVPFLILALGTTTPLWVALAFICASNFSAEAVLAGANTLFVLLLASALPLKTTAFHFVNPVTSELLIAQGSFASLATPILTTPVAALIALRTFRWLD